MFLSWLCQLAHQRSTSSQRHQWLIWLSLNNQLLNNQLLNNQLSQMNWFNSWELYAHQCVGPYRSWRWHRQLMLFLDCNLFWKTCVLLWRALCVRLEKILMFFGGNSDRRYLSPRLTFMLSSMFAGIAGLGNFLGGWPQVHAGDPRRPSTFHVCNMTVVLNVTGDRWC